MSSKEQDDTKTMGLLARARAGDRAAYDELFSRVAERVLFFLRLRLGPALGGKIEPIDLLQETYAEAHRAFPNFEYAGEGSFVRWLCRIGENQIREAADHFAAAKRRPPGEALAVTRVLERVRATATGPGTAFAREESRQLLAQAILALGEEEREAILLRFFQDRTIDEIAGTLGRSPTAVRRLLGRAAASLGSLLREGGLETSGL